MTVVLTKIAEADLEGIGDHIARDNPARAVTFIAELRQACAELDLFPEAHALAEGLEARLVRRHS
ncbi:MAG: type II toxin-antitoxin system RelE/ParE family toxin, partial [Bifidobacteriaceae bacterium]|nr:type II toxin-antitoxin system RelE/ParE family toxin [Bifidobacteriaceae bacterium]